MSYRSNPPWSNDILTSQWDQILAAGGASLMPKHTKARTKIKAEEFGTGHYGVVMPTVTPSIVMKITSDSDEADFITWVTLHTQFGKDHPGLIPYYRIAQLHGSQRLKRDVFVLWRAEAEDVGATFPEYSYAYGDYANWQQDYDVRSGKEAAKRLVYFKDYAHFARTKLKPMSAAKRLEVLGMLSDVRGETDPDESPRNVLERGPRKIALAIEGARVQAEMMANEPGATEVGQCLLDLLEDHGILLADVHQGNIGMYKPADFSKPIRVITDPGHAIFLTAGLQENDRKIGKWW